MKKLGFSFAAAAIFTTALAATAHADDTKTKGDLVYEFQDPDLLNASQLGGNTAQITVLKGKNRDKLHRPRLSFVPELLKSVENM